MDKISKNSVALAGEFAVLSRLALLGYDANMVLGHTKGVDILVSRPNTKRMYRLEVKTSRQAERRSGKASKVFGDYKFHWMVGSAAEKHDDPSLFYCFVSIDPKTYQYRFFVVPSRIVAEYVKTEHYVWLKSKPTHKTSEMRQFRLGTKVEKYPFKTPFVEDYEDNWNFDLKIGIGVRKSGKSGQGR